VRVPLAASLAGARGGAVMSTMGVGARLDGSAKTYSAHATGRLSPRRSRRRSRWWRASRASGYASAGRRRTAAWRRFAAAPHVGGEHRELRVVRPQGGVAQQLEGGLPARLTLVATIASFGLCVRRAASRSS